jgi:hypothetical protein
MDVGMKKRGCLGDCWVDRSSVAQTASPPLTLLRLFAVSVSHIAVPLLCRSMAVLLLTQVPDRGGRPEGRAREANMPEW